MLISLLPPGEPGQGISKLNPITQLIFDGCVLLLQA